MRRTAIDRLRVALSRATENLILVDVAPDDRARQLCLELLGTAERFTAGDLLELFEDADYPPDERIYTRTNDARTLADVSLERAWERALQALRLLGGADGRALVDDQSVQHEVCLTVLGVGARRLVEDGLEGEMRDTISQTAEAVTQDMGESEAVQGGEGACPVDCQSDGTAARPARGRARTGRIWTEPGWMRPFPPCSSNCGRQSGTVQEMQVPRTASRATSKASWKVAGFMGDVGEEARRLRRVALDAAGRRSRLQDCQPR